MTFERSRNFAKLRALVLNLLFGTTCSSSECEFPIPLALQPRSEKRSTKPGLDQETIIVEHRLCFRPGLGDWMAIIVKMLLPAANTLRIYKRIPSVKKVRVTFGLK